MTENGNGSVEARVTSVPGQTVDSQTTYSGTVTPLSPVVAPSTEHGTDTDLARPVCSCGRGPHALLGVDTDGNPGICELGHPLPGNQRTRKSPLAPVLEDKPINLENFSALSLSKQAAMLLAEQMEEQKLVIRATRTVSQRRRERKVMAELSTELRSHMTQIERLQPFKANASASNLLQHLSNDTLQRVLAEIGCDSLNDVPHYDGPAMLRIQLTDEATDDTPIASPAPAQRVDMPSQPVLERVPIPIEALGEDSYPKLAKGAQTAEQPTPAQPVQETPTYRTWFEDGGRRVHESEYMPPGPVGR